MIINFMWGLDGKRLHWKPYFDSVKFILTTAPLVCWLFPCR